MGCHNLFGVSGAFVQGGVHGTLMEVHRVSVGDEVLLERRQKLCWPSDRCGWMTEEEEKAHLWRRDEWGLPPSLSSPVFGPPVGTECMCMIQQEILSPRVQQKGGCVRATGEVTHHGSGS